MDINESRIKDIIEEHVENTISTIEIIRKYFGSYEKNTGTPGSLSENADFGRKLKEMADTLGIVEIASKTPQKDDNGERTSCSIWQIIK